MNYLQLVQRLHSETLRSTAAPTTVVGANDRNARLFNRVADAWREVQSERDWKWMRATTDATLEANKQTYTGTELGATRFARWRPGRKSKTTLSKTTRRNGSLVSWHHQRELTAGGPLAPWSSVSWRRIAPWVSHSERMACFWPEPRRGSG